MKTITLTEEAYELLANWKTSPKDSFSKVITRVVPRKGTLGQLADDMRMLAPLTEGQAELMHSVVRESRDIGREKDPWTS
jgi:predicted CopG family antitoxin